MIEIISSIEELNLPNLDGATIMLVLCANNDNYEELLSYAEFINYPEFIACFPKRDEEINRTRRFILSQINRRCKNTAVKSIDSIVFFKVKDGRVNFWPKRAVSVFDALEYKVANNIEELLNLVSLPASNSISALDKEIEKYLNKGIIEGSLGIDVSTEGIASSVIPIKLGYKVDRKWKMVFNKIITK